MSEIITLKGIIDEDFVNYRVPSMTLMFPTCNGKCGELCQNKELINAPDIKISTADIYERYANNPISKAIVFQGLEPFDNFEDIFPFLVTFRENSTDDIVIYTGYTKEEIEQIPYVLARLKQIPNIIIKFGRYIPNQKTHYDNVLGVNLASDNQFAEKIS